MDLKSKQQLTDDLAVTRRRIQYAIQKLQIEGVRIVDRNLYTPEDEARLREHFLEQGSKWQRKTKT